MCEELKERFERFRRRDLYGIRLVALFLDATFIAVRPDGPKEGVQVAAIERLEARSHSFDVLGHRLTSMAEP